MGNWHISIEGVGCHHNNNWEKDADKMTKDFVKELKKAGHSISKASFTYGGSEDVNELPIQS